MLLLATATRCCQETVYNVTLTKQMLALGPQLACYRVDIWQIFPGQGDRLRSDEFPLTEEGEAIAWDAYRFCRDYVELAFLETRL